MRRRCRRSPGACRDGGCYRWRREAFDVRARTGRAGAGAARPRRAAELRRPGGGRARERAGAPAGRAARCGSRAGPPTSRSTPASSTTSSPAACRPGSRRAETLVKEAEEEAAIPASLARQARAGRRRSPTRWSGRKGCGATCCTATTWSCRRISCPAPADGEVEAFELWPIARVVADGARHGRVQVQRQPGADRPVPADGAGMTMGIAALNPSYVVTRSGCIRRMGRAQRNPLILSTCAAAA